MTDIPEKWYSKSVTIVPWYSYLHQHTGRVSIGLRNLTSKTVVIKPRTTIATISVAAVVPPYAGTKGQHEIHHLSAVLIQCLRIQHRILQKELAQLSLLFPE